MWLCTNKQQLGTVDPGLPFGEKITHFLLKSAFVVSSDGCTGTVRIALGIVVGRLRATLLSAGSVSVERLVCDDCGSAIFHSGFLGELRCEGHDHASKVATSDHAKEIVRAGGARVLVEA